jgi:hypothetical protein
MHCLPFTKRIEGDYSREVKGNDRFTTGLKSNCRKCLNCGQVHQEAGKRCKQIGQMRQAKPGA